MFRSIKQYFNKKNLKDKKYEFLFDETPNELRIMSSSSSRLLTGNFPEYEQLEAFIEKDEWIGDPVLVRKEELLDEMSSRVRNYDGRRGGADYLRAISQDIDVLLDFMG